MVDIFSNKVSSSFEIDRVSCGRTGAYLRLDCGGRLESNFEFRAGGGEVKFRKVHCYDVSSFHRDAVCCLICFITFYGPVTVFTRILLRTVHGRPLIYNADSPLVVPQCPSFTHTEVS